MKKVLASLLTAYVLTNGQAPPQNVVDFPPQTATPVDVVPNTVANQPAASGTTIAPAGTTQAQATTAAGRTGPISATTQAGTTARPVASAAPAQSTAAPPAATSGASQTTAAGSATTAPLTTLAPAGTTQAQATTAAGTTAAPAPVTTVAPTTTTLAPVTPAPVTPAPTFNPYCPMDAGLQSGFDPRSVQFNENAVCFQPAEIATDYLGRLRCDNFACCQCAQINCGFNGYPCEQVQFGDSGAVGVRSINIRGAPELNNNPLQNIFGGGFGHHGAKLECSGRESCLGAIIRGEMLITAQCSGDMGCQGAKIIINDPMPMMNMQCNGLSSCSGADIEINVGVAEAASRAPGQACNPAFAGTMTELGKVEFNGQWAGSNAKVTIRNEGCGTLLFDSFECMNLEACPGLAVTIEGNVAIRHCDLMGIAPANPLVQSLVAACQAGQNYGAGNMGNQFPFPGQGQPTFPNFPQQPQVPIIPPNPGQQPPIIPSNPVNPPVLNTPPVITPPVVNPNPNPGFPIFPGFGAVDPRSASMQCDQIGMPAFGGFGNNPRACAGTTQTIQISNGWVLDCSLAGACNGMTLTLNAGRDPNNPMVPVTYIDSIKFIQATSGVTIYINNDFGASGQALRVQDVRCENPGACNNLKIIAGPGVDILSTNYDCSSITACMGATVQQGAMSMAIDPRTQGMSGYPFGQAQPQTFPAQQMPFNPWV